MNRKDSMRRSGSLEHIDESGGKPHSGCVERPPYDREEVSYRKDMRLVERYVSGKPGAALEILSQCEPVMVKAIMRILTLRRPAEDHEEVLSMADISLLESVHRYEGRASLRSFSSTLAANEARKFLTRTGRFPLSTKEPEANEGDDEESGAAQRTAEDLVGDKEYFEKCLEKLNTLLLPRELMVLSMRYVDGLSTEQCAAILDISHQGVYTIVFQARSKARSVKTILDSIDE